MTLLGANVRIIPRYTWLGQQCENVFTYNLNGAPLVTASAADVAEAWWNDFKTDLRALCPAVSAWASFDSVFVTELVSGGAYGEYAIPSGERVGTRAGVSDDLPLPGFVCGGVRLVVGTRATRPGQKRFPFVTDVDVDGNSLGGTYFGLLDTVADHCAANISFGGGLVGSGASPVVGGTVVSGFPTVFQSVTGYVTSHYVTSQVSRKLGHGS